MVNTNMMLNSRWLIMINGTAAVQIVVATSLRLTGGLRSCRSKVSVVMIVVTGINKALF